VAGGSGGRLQTCRVAVVDDEPALCEAVGFALRRQDFEVETWSSGRAALEAWAESLPDLVVLDIVMPEMDGLELCRRLRGRSEQLPILFLSSRDEELDRVLCLELGADDYLCKPFGMRELVARVRVLLRRLSMPRAGPDDGPDRRLRAGPLELDLLRYTARWQGVEVPLTVTEFRVLRALARHPGHVKTRRQLLEAGHPDDVFVSERTVDSHLRRMRRKFESVDAAFVALDTVHGLGYRLRVAGERD
jgi:DNA-binding response OmpR family regulator